MAAYHRGRGCAGSRSLRERLGLLPRRASRAASKADIEELRAVLLREHVGRVRHGLVWAARPTKRTSETGRSYRIRPASFP